MFKDEILNKLADSANVAQFISFGPNAEQRFSRVSGFSANHDFGSVSQAAAALISASPEKSVNVRSFRPGRPQGNEFHYGLTLLDVVISHITRLTGSGFYVIINETVDVNDGGVSGVLQGGCLEFAPGVIPRFVEKDSKYPISSLPKDLGLEMLETVYGFKPSLHYPEGYRAEFSIHPKARGWHHKHTIIWEVEQVEEISITPYYIWPNLFSCFIGDKAYGLLLAHLKGLAVPRTTFFPRNSRLGLFTFGKPTGSGEKWTRTCPKIQEPGRFSTIHKWVDPFEFMEKDDPDNQYLASCIVQEGVESIYSGAVITDSDGNLILEGVKGFGDQFMLGKARADILPNELQDALRQVYKTAFNLLGDVRFEWAYDGTQIWILQLHVGRSISSGRIIVPGERKKWLDFEVDKGLEELRATVAMASKENFGISLRGHVGMSSHVADVLRKAGIPARMEN
jgi:hypothetical protein